MKQAKAEHKGSENEGARPTGPRTWREVHPAITELITNLRAGAIEHDAAEIALTALIPDENADEGADPGELGAGDTLALAALRALEDIGRLISENAREARRLYRPDVPGDHDAKMRTVSGHVHGIRLVTSLAMDLYGLYRVATDGVL